MTAGIVLQRIEPVPSSAYPVHPCAYCPLTRPNRFSGRIFQLGPQGIAVECCTAGLRSTDGLAPVQLNGRVLVDGGWVDKVPVLPAYRLGAEFVIAVDISAEIEDTQNYSRGVDVMIRADYGVLPVVSKVGSAASLHKCEYRTRMRLETLSAGSRLGGFFPERQVHALMPAVLLGMPWFDALDANAEAEPPHGQLAQAEQGVGTCERNAVIGTDGFGQTEVLEGAFEDGKGIGLFSGFYRRPGSRAHGDLRPLSAGSGRRAAYGSVAIDGGFGQRPVL